MHHNDFMKIKVIYKNTLSCFMHVNKAPPLVKMAYFKPKRHLVYHSQNAEKKIIKEDNMSADALQRNKYTVIHHQSSVLIFSTAFKHISATLMHQYQPGGNGQPVNFFPSNKHCMVK